MSKVKNIVSSFLCYHQEYNDVYILGENIQKEFIDELKLSTIGNIYVNIDKIDNNKKNLIILYDCINKIEELAEKYNDLYLLFIGQDKDGFYNIWKKYKNKISKIDFIFEDKYNNYVSSWNRVDNNIELSIILPVYNIEKYLDQCIKTLIEDKNEMFEFIFVDDGSTDNSASIIKKYQVNDKRLIYYKKPNGGCASARNFGLKHAKGRYVGFVDPDDYVDPTMFSKLFKKAFIYGLDIVWCGFNKVYEDSGKIVHADDLDLKMFEIPCFNKNIINTLIGLRRIAIWRAIYRKDFLFENDIFFFEDLKRFDDLPFKIMTFLYAKSISSINEYLYYYRLGREGQDVSVNDEKLFIQFKIFEKLDEIISKYNDNTIKKFYYLCKVDTHLWALNKIDKSHKDEYAKKTINNILTIFNKQEIINFSNEILDNKKQKLIRKNFNL